MKTMKFLTILVTAFLLKSCGTTKSSAMEEQNNATLNGEYTVTLLQENSDIPSTVVLKFDDATKRVTGNTGCNSFFGNYKTVGKTITFDKIATTKMLCNDAKNNTESNILSVFKKADAFSLEGNKLTLLEGKNSLLNAKQNTDRTMEAQQNDISLISYSAYSRGSAYDIKITPKTITLKKDRTAKETTKPCTKEDWSTLLSLLNTIDANTIPELEAPSKAHQYDGAAIARFSVVKGSETYTTKAFDGGNPHKNIAAIIEKMIELAN